MKCMTPETLAETALPPVPLTVEGASVLHQMMRFRRPAWRALTDEARAEILLEAGELLGDRERFTRRPADRGLLAAGAQGRPDVRPFPPQLRGAGRGATGTRHACSLSDYLEPVHSYLSIIELGLYESTSKTYGELAAKGVVPHSEEWKARNRSRARAVAQGHGAAALARNPAGQIPLLLSHGPQARGIRELVHGADERPRSA